jgi:hypothetical protein
MKTALRTKRLMKKCYIDLRFIFNMQALLKKQGKYVDTHKWEKPGQIRFARRSDWVCPIVGLAIGP